MAVSGKGFALTSQLRSLRYRGLNPLVEEGIDDAGHVIVADLLFVSGGTTQTLTATRFDNAESFYPSVVTQPGPGTQTLSPSLFNNSQSFYSPIISVGAVVLSPVRFDNTQSFYAATITTGSVVVSPGLFTNTNAFYSPTVTLLGGLQTLNPSLFTNTNTFYSATVYDPASSGSSIRYDISTGRLVKIINNYVCISL